MNKCKSCGYINFQKDKVCRGCGMELGDVDELVLPEEPEYLTVKPKIGGIKLKGSSSQKISSDKTLEESAVPKNGGIKFDGSHTHRETQTESSAEAIMPPKGGIKLGGGSTYRNSEQEKSETIKMPSKGGVKLKGTSSEQREDTAASAENKNISKQSIKFDTNYSKNSVKSEKVDDTKYYRDNTYTSHKKIGNRRLNRWVLAAAAVLLCTVIAVKSSAPDSHNVTPTSAAAAQTYAPQISSSDIIEEEISALFSSESFKSANDEARRESVEEKLTELSSQGSISDYSYDDSNQLYSFEYSDGVLGGVSLSDGDDQLDTAGYSGELSDISYVASSSGVCNVLILNAFENSEFRRAFYSELISKWNNMGMNISYDVDVTVNDLYNLGQYDTVIFAMHGSVYRGSPVLCINQTVTNSSDKDYKAELSSQQIAKVMTVNYGWEYWIFPKFFSDHYSEGSLYGCFIYAQACKFFGSDEISTSLDTSFSEAFMKASARAVCGCHNSVLSIYSRNVMSATVEGVFSGQHPVDALDAAKAKYGNTDGREKPEEHKFYAYPVCFVDDTQFLEVEPSFDTQHDAINTYKYMLLVNEYDGALLQLPGEQPFAAQSFYLFDMNGDGIDELLTFGMDENYRIAFKLYTYRNGEPVLLADSVNSCDISEWWNASFSLNIYDGKYLSACAHGVTTASIGSGSYNLFSYNGKSVTRESKERPGSYSYCVELLYTDNGIPAEIAESYFDAILDTLN